MGVLTDRQRDALRRLDRYGPNGHAAVHKGSLPGLLKRGLVAKERTWADNGNGRVVWSITPAGRAAISPTIRAAGTLDLTVHRRDPTVEPKMRPASGAGSHYRAITDTPDNRAATPQLAVREWEGHAGATVCGRLLELSELWVDHEPEPDDRFCPGCFDGEPVDDEPDLWEDDNEWQEGEPARSVETVNVAGGVL